MTEWLGSLLFWLGSVFVLIQLVTVLVNSVSFPVLGSRPRMADSPVTSILIPARNEAATLPYTLPTVLAQEADEVIVLDDASTDATADVLAGIAQREPRLRVISGQALPAGWNGKNWACHQLAEVAAGEVLIFTDADVYWHEDGLASLQGFMSDRRADLVSVWPRQIAESFFERAAVPIVDLILLAGLPYPGVTRLPYASLAAGNGQLMMWRRAAYQAVGGHAAFCKQVLEDVRMAQAAKAQGLRLRLALGGDLLSTRMYRSLSEIVAGFAKNILAAAGSKPALVGLLALNTLIYGLAWIFALFELRWLIIALLGLALRFFSLLKTGRNLWETLLQPLSLIPLWLIGLRALRQGGSYNWKGRRYDRG